MKHIFLSSKGLGNLGGGLNFNRYQSLGQPLLSISGDQADVGKITESNSEGAGIFGFERKDIIGNQIEQLFPESVRKKLESTLKVNLTYSTVDTTGILKVNREQFMLGRHKTGFLFPVLVAIREHPTYNNSYNMIISLTSDKRRWTQDKGYLLANQELEIEGMSSTCLTILKMDKKITNYKFSVSRFFPSITRENISQYYVDEGKVITFVPLIMNSKYLFIYICILYYRAKGEHNTNW